MPTPLAYSRSSSFTSLNSFDIKSVHSEVASEYSHYPSVRLTKKSSKKKLDRINSDADDDDDQNSDTEEEGEETEEEEQGDEDQGEKSHKKAYYRHIGQNQDANDTYEDDYDFDKLMPESPAAPADSSFVMQQRIKHKQLQMHYREKAAANMQLNSATDSDIDTGVNYNASTTTTTTTIAASSLNTNFLEQKTSIENIISKHEGEKQQQQTKMWQNVATSRLG